MKQQGNITKRGKETYRIDLRLGKDENCKRVRYVETVHGSKSAAIARVNALRAGRDKGITLPKAHITVGDLLRNWLDTYVKTNCSPLTIVSYTSVAEKYLIPVLGHYQLRELNYRLIEQYYAGLRETLTPRTIAKHHRELAQALKWGVKKGLLGTNPIERVDSPRWTPKQMRTLTPQEVDTFLEAAEASEYYPMYYTAVHSGLRLGELCGLRWRDLNLEMARLSVEQSIIRLPGKWEARTPKTSYSRRTVHLTPKLALYLRDYRAYKEATYRLITDEPLPEDSFVFGFLNEPCKAVSVSHHFTRIARQVGLKDISFHSLRHTFASLMLSRGANPKVVSEALGHASIAFTLQTYAHIIEGMQEKAMELLNDVLPKAKRDTFFDTTNQGLASGKERH